MAEGTFWGARAERDDHIPSGGPSRCSGLSTAPGGSSAARLVRVTHPFHPLSGREFPFVEYRHSWREYRVWFCDDAAELRSLPAEWTSAGCADPVVAAGRGRSPFRAEDLLQLAGFIHELASKCVTENMAME